MRLTIKRDHTIWCTASLDEIELLRAYLAGLMQHLVDEKERFQNEIETVILYENEEYSHEVRFFRGLDDASCGLEHLFSQHFPNLLLRSTLVCFYSFAEVTLDTLCKRFEDHMQLSVSVSDMKGKGISRAKKYLTKHCGIDFGSLEPWRELKNIATVRNLITHADGRITKATRQELQSYVTNSRFLRQDGEELILSPEYLDRFLDVMTDLIQEIGKQIQTQQSPAVAVPKAAPEELH